MAIQKLSVLLVEDSVSDAKLLSLELKRAIESIELERVEDGDAMRSALGAQRWDVVISDWSLPTFSGLSALALVGELGLDIPFIIVSGTIGEEVAVAAMQAGAHDYLIKGNLKRLVPAIEREIREARVRAARRTAEVELVKAAQRYRALFEHSPLPSWVCEPTTHALLAVNEAAVLHYGYTREEFAKLSILDLQLAEPAVEAYGDWVGEQAQAGQDERASRHKRKDGTAIWVGSRATISSSRAAPHACT